MCPLIISRFAGLTFLGYSVDRRCKKSPPIIVCSLEADRLSRQGKSGSKSDSFSPKEVRRMRLIVKIEVDESTYSYAISSLFTPRLPVIVMTFWTASAIVQRRRIMLMTCP